MELAIPKIGDWLTIKTEFPWSSTVGKVASVDLEKKTFQANFSCDPDEGDYPSFEAESTHYFSEVHEIIRQSEQIEEFEKWYAEAFPH